jgi:DNA adenine methylase
VIAPPFPYFGGKQILGPRIAGLFPAHGHYVEPFAGSLAVLFAKQPSAMETVNDLDRDLVTFWRVLRDRPDELIRAVAFTPHSRAEFDQSHDRDGCDDLERARRVHVQLTQGRGAVGVKSGWRHYVKPTGGTGMPDYLTGYLRRFGPAVERLQHVSLECRPALDVIATYGRDPDVLLYVDPPYLGTARAGGNDPRGGTRRYRHEMLDADAHRELLTALLDCRAAVVLSGYPSPFYHEYLMAWSRVEFAAGTGQSARGEWSTRTEVLWSNRTISSPTTLFDVVDSLASQSAGGER